VHEDDSMPAVDKHFAAGRFAPEGTANVRSVFTATRSNRSAATSAPKTAHATTMRHAMTTTRERFLGRVSDDVDDGAVANGVVTASTRGSSAGFVSS
jgi:hypothetical protein